MGLSTLLKYLSFISFANAQTPFIIGQGCPKVKPNGFDAKKYTGLWFDIASTPENKDSSGSSCVWSKYFETSSEQNLAIVNSEVRSTSRNPGSNKKLKLLKQKFPDFSVNPKLAFIYKKSKSRNPSPNRKFKLLKQKFPDFTINPKLAFIYKKLSSSHSFGPKHRLGGHKFGRNHKKARFIKSKLEQRSKRAIEKPYLPNTPGSKTKRYYSIGEAYLSPKIDGELHVTMFGESGEFANRYTILDTDNDKYSYVWSCTSVCVAAKCFANRPNLWILNRDSNLSEEEVSDQVNQAFSILENSGYNTTKLLSYVEIKEQSDCGYDN